MKAPHLEVPFTFQPDIPAPRVSATTASRIFTETGKLGVQKAEPVVGRHTKKSCVIVSSH